MPRAVSLNVNVSLMCCQTTEAVYIFRMFYGSIHLVPWLPDTNNPDTVCVCGTVGRGSKNEKVGWHHELVTTVTVPGTHGDRLLKGTLFPACIGV